jgi:uncharacterized protein (DUF302 family)
MHPGKQITMESRDAIMTLAIDYPFDSALPRIRRAILEGQLCISAEIDAAQRVKRALQIYVPPCRVLLIDNPAFLLETTAVDRASGLFLPVHLVVSGAGDRTLVYLLHLDHMRHSDLPIGVRAPVLDLQRQLVRSLRRIVDSARSSPELADRGESRFLAGAAHQKHEPKVV